MRTLYRSWQGHEAIAAWCADRLDRWPVPHERATVTARGARTHVVIAGRGQRTVVVVPGTDFSAAACLPLITALAARCRVVVADLPGQPGLSSAERVPAAGRLDWYGRWLGDVIERTAPGAVTVLGHSLGAAVALACPSARVQRQVLVSPGGLVRLRITPGVLAASLAWVVRRDPASSAALLRVMHGPGRVARPELVEWMTLIARHVRSSADPGRVPIALREVARSVVVGEADVFLPARRLAPIVRERLGVELGVLPAAGHLVIDEHPEELADLATDAITGG